VEVVACLSFLPDFHRLHWHQLAWRTQRRPDSDGPRTLSEPAGRGQTRGPNIEFGLGFPSGSSSDSREDKEVMDSSVVATDTEGEPRVHAGTVMGRYGRGGVESGVDRERL